MSDETTETTSAPAKKAATAPRKKAAKKAAAPKAAKVAVVMVGNSRGVKHGERRMVDAATAKRLIANGHARKPE